MFLLFFACVAETPDAGRPPRDRPDRGDTADDGVDTGASDGGDSGDPGDSGEDSGAGDSGDIVEPPLGGTSGGSGGADAPSSTTMTVDGTSYRLLAPVGSARGSAVPLLVTISGTEGADAMMANLRQVAPYYGLGDALVAVLDGRSASAEDGFAVLEAVRAAYDVDNDRTWLLSESAGTAAGLELAFDVAPTYFAAYWANDVNARATPSVDAAALGFVPWGNAGPGGDQPDADAIVEGMRWAGWSLPADAPYSGAGADTHGSPEQFLAAVDFFADKAR